MKALSFEGKGIEYFKIWIVNILLTIVTVGLYHPWAKVRSHRYLYANSTLEDRNFEYHATGKQLFLGYIIAMALLITYIVIEKIFPGANLILLGILFLAVPWLILRSMIFNMRMMSFSNVHFGFKGKAAQAYINFFAYPIGLYLGFIILGFIMAFASSIGGVIGGLLGLVLIIAMFAFMIYAFSFIKKKNTEFFVDNSLYGQGTFKTDLELKPLMLITLKTIGISILVLFAVGIVMALAMYLTGSMNNILALQGLKDNPEAMPGAMTTLLPLIGASYAGMIFASIFIVAYSMSRHREYIYANTSLGDGVSFSSTLKALPFAWLLLSNFLLIIFTFGLAYPWAKVRSARMILENTLVKADNGFDSYISQEQKTTSSVGEQIGEAFDVGVGVGI